MKKFIAILLLGLYGFSVSGASVQLHYCCGKVAGVTVGYEKASGCKHSGQYNMPGCCFDQQVKMDVDDEQGFAASASAPAPVIVSTIPIFSWDEFPVVLPLLQTTQEIRGSPPLILPVPIYLRNQVFRN